MKNWFLVLACSLLSLASQAQDKPEAEVQALLERFFVALNAGDSAELAACLDPRAQMLSTTYGMENRLVQEWHSGQELVEAMPRTRKKTWREEILAWNIQVDAHLAHVQAPYVFHLGQGISHCGVNFFTLLKTDDQGWQIVYLADTRRQDACIEYVESFKSKPDKKKKKKKS